MTFERLSNWFGRDYTQTLEPRLFYLNIPYENQDDIPVFDTDSPTSTSHRSSPITSFPAGIASTTPIS
jgi:lipopolysaccharide assembly outer membrane protein LptD (OstA)